jgi:peptide/nickel transport system ATP-binding protein
MQPLLRIENLSVNFVTDMQVTTAVQGISLTVNRGEIVAIVGESGSGKSVTSLSILRLLAQPPARYASGQIIFSEDGEQTIDLLQASPRLLQELRGHRIAMIFQEPMSSLNPVMTCGHQVVEALRAHRTLSPLAAREEAIKWFEKVKLPQPAQLFHRYPHQLSGGQKQRVMIAMAMCCQPSLLICDEPTTALDVTVQKNILELIRELQQQEHMGVIFITHDLGVVAQIADRVAIMYKGQLVEENDAQIIFRAPAHPYTQALIACRPALHPKGEKLPVVADFLQPENTVKKSKLTETNMRKQEPEILVNVEHLSVRFPGKTNWLGRTSSWVTAVDDVSFSIFRQETLGLVGESGCGKTTLGRTLLRLAEPSSGRILFGDKDITQLTKAEVKNLRKDVQLVFQDPYGSLNPRLTIGAAIMEPMKTGGLANSSRERKKKASALLEQVSLSPRLMDRYPHEFSGGQRQRIVIARALALNPTFLVCDESVSALDVSVQAQVLNLLNDLKKELGLTMLFISHDLSVVRYMCDRMLVMQQGRIVESGQAEEVYRHPKNPYTRQLIEAIPVL